MRLSPDGRISDARLGDRVPSQEAPRRQVFACPAQLVEIPRNINVSAEIRFGARTSPELDQEAVIAEQEVGSFH